MVCPCSGEEERRLEGAQGGLPAHRLGGLITFNSPRHLQCYLLHLSLQDCVSGLEGTFIRVWKRRGNKIIRTWLWENKFAPSGGPIWCRKTLFCSRSIAVHCYILPPSDYTRTPGGDVLHGGEHIWPEIQQ
ncbi:hypothetical protein GDO81_015415 [Engystomops pustulosus]|uniref:Uncharacterized protein n=1 Tax=Engystomops pustulosus TaxID=76066 RepID=A0AAV7ANG2_ENGPU|nr:hypothetical protein GDO81_015415 [Engystomops pustulosus]